MTDQHLSKAIAIAVGDLERDGELVVTTPNIHIIADRIAEAALAVVPNTNLTLEELLGVRSLIFHAINNKQFFDWEMPTLTGYSAAEFRKIAEKISRA